MRNSLTGVHSKNYRQFSLTDTEVHSENYRRFINDLNSNLAFEEDVMHFFDRLFPYPISESSKEYEDCLKFSEAVAISYGLPIETETVFHILFDWSATQMY